MDRVETIGPNEDATLYNADCRHVMNDVMEPESVDSIVTDPPYGLSFMGRAWDHGVPGVPFWKAALRVAKPGAHLLAFGGTRTFHRLAVAIEDAGWEIRDTVMWVYGSGFPKSLDVSKAIDKMAGAEREVVPNPLASKQTASIKTTDYGDYQAVTHITPTPATDAAKQWDGWGTALKPAHEDIIWAVKPLHKDGELSIILRNLSTMEARLWSILPANIAEKCLGLSQSGYEEALSSAQWSAERRRNIRDGLSEVMDTSRLGTAISTILNTVSLWKNILVERLSDTNKSTIEMKTSLITDLKTLRYCSSEIMQDTTIKEAIIQNGFWWNVSTAASLFNDELMRMSDTRIISAAESVTSKDGGEDLRPNAEPVIVARKPVKGTVAANVLRHGTGAINVDGCRVAHNEPIKTMKAQSGGNKVYGQSGRYEETTELKPQGRFPANLIHDGSDEVLRLFPVTGAAKASMRGEHADIRGDNYGRSNGERLNGSDSMRGHNDNGGSAARFFYCAKADKEDRDEGLEGFEEHSVGDAGRHTMSGPMAKNYTAKDGVGRTRPRRNNHPTVKPTDLMRYLVRLVTPPGGVVLDPFMGSGSTGKASGLDSFRFVGIDNTEEPGAFEIAIRRVQYGYRQPSLFEGMV